MKSRFWIACAAGALFLPALPVLADEDCAFPVTPETATGKILSDVRVRDLGCMAQSTILTTIKSGTIVPVTGEADGWYRITLADGISGFVWQSYLTITDAENAPTPAPAPVVAPTPTPAPKPAASLAARVTGRILLQVQNNGEAWYVNPTDGLRYYMKDGPTAYQMMRAFGLGITDADFMELQAGDATLVARLKGRIVLTVQQHGEAYYVDPDSGVTHYLQNGDAAYTIMRQLSLGITNADLAQLPSKDFVAPATPSQPTAPTAPTTPTDPVVPTPPTPAPPAIPGEYQTIGLSAEQGGTVPAGLDLVALNQYWLAKINTLRAAKGLRQLVLDQRFVDTASEWAAYMGENDNTTHDRPDGSTANQWIDTKGLAFTKRYSPGGWQTNYFTENIAWGIADGNMASVESVLDDTLTFYLSEAATNGAHYRTIYYPDWNTLGAGFYFRPDGNGYKVFIAFHYGSLQL